MFHSLKITLLLSHTGIILFTNILLASVSYHYIHSSLETSQKEHLTFIADHAARSINNFLAARADLLDRIADGQEIVHYSTNYRETALASYLAGFHHSFPNLSFINERGVEEMRIIDGEISQNFQDFSQSLFFKKTLSHPNKALIFQDEMFNNPKAPALKLAIAKFRYSENKFAGMLLATLPYEKIAESLTDIKIGENGYLAVSDALGNIMSLSNQPSLGSVGKVMFCLAKEEEGPANLFAPPAQEGQPGFLRVPVRGVDSFVAKAYIQEPRWTILAILPHEEFMRQVKKMRLGFLYLFITFFILASILSYLLSKGITLPLSRLTQAAKGIAQGNLSEIAVIKSQDEIGRLIGSFNVMTRNLKETTISRDYFNTILSSMQESLVVLGHDGAIEMINNSTSAMLGYELHELAGRPLGFILKQDEAAVNCPFSNLAEGEIIRECELSYRTKWGKEIPVHFSASPMRDSKGEIYGIVCLAINISKRKKMEESLRQSETRLREIAITDELTSLLNRRGFMTMATRQLLVAKRQEENIFLIFADVDNLKGVNDNMGHHAGDQVLIETAQLLRQTFRDSDIIARLGGDEFAVLLVDPTDEKTVMSRLDANMEERNRVAGRSYNLSMSTGMVRYDPEYPQSIEELMNQADTLMYECKQKRKRGIR
ncbi:MAG: diguanylate cyclase [Deltaproteobacteria bacterium]|nr:diguanylate cyclase [Deltaproteobacteria bacterium]